MSDKVERNMYGCWPCPKCKSEYRFSLANNPGTAVCLDCGYDEPNADIAYDGKDEE